MEESGRTEGSISLTLGSSIHSDGPRISCMDCLIFASIALAKDKEVVAGVIFDPVKDEVLGGTRDRRFRQQSALWRGIGPPPSRGLHHCYWRTIQSARALQSVLSNSYVQSCSRLPASDGMAPPLWTSLMAGRYDGFWENGLNQWDVAAGILLVREAGGFVTDLHGSRYELGADIILATNEGCTINSLRSSCGNSVQINLIPEFLL